MKHSLLTVLLFLSMQVFGQTTYSIGTDDNPILTDQESALLTSFVKDSINTFDLTNKKVAFVTGNPGNILLTKQRYFEECVDPWISHNLTPRLIIVVLTEEEKIKSGGYDALILGSVKVFTKRQKKKIIQQLGEDKP